MQTNSSHEQYKNLLKTYNEHTNIYSKNAYDHLEKHILDSITLAKIIGNKPSTLFDFGSGSGLPSVLIALENPKLQVYAIESKSRKTKFLDLVKEALHLQNFHVINENINEFIHKTNLKPRYITAKAFGPPEKILSFATKINHAKPTIYIPISEAQAKDYSLISNARIIHQNNFIYCCIQC
jgi:16S rRNA (guanine(527)-N(7))-methyltransferase RsmG